MQRPYVNREDVNAYIDWLESKVKDQTSGVGLCLKIDGTSGSPELERHWATVARDIFELWKRKQHDYGPHNIGLLGDLGVLTRVTDKFMRLHNLYKLGAAINDKYLVVISRACAPGTIVGTRELRSVEYETLDDTWMDIADYAIIALMFRRGMWPKSTLVEAIGKPFTEDDISGVQEGS